MKKIFLASVLSLSLAYASNINSIAITVNDDIITVYDIETTMRNGKMNKQQAVDKLVDKVLFDQEVEKFGVKVSDEEYLDYVKKIAKSNGLSLENFKNAIQQKYGNYSLFEAQTKHKILQEKLIGQVARGNLKIATDKDLKNYYDNNKESYSSANIFDVVEYSSSNREALSAVVKNPMISDSSIAKQDRRLSQTNLNPQIKFLLNNTKAGTFTPIMQAGEGFVMLYLKNKQDYSVVPFEQVKRSIFEKMMFDRESTYAKDYFEKLRITADIEVLK